VDGTYSAIHYKDDISDEVKQARLSRLMRVQQDISAQISEVKVGKTFKTMIDRLEGDYYVGRTEFDSPEVDPEVLIKADAELPVGEFLNVRITEADAFDLYGKVEQ
jgi:ribosomal protein S12 methylthiotransferase